jgi:hypothetical protein
VALSRYFVRRHDISSRRGLQFLTPSVELSDALQIGFFFATHIRVDKMPQKVARRARIVLSNHEPPSPFVDRRSPHAGSPASWETTMHYWPCLVLFLFSLLPVTSLDPVAAPSDATKTIAAILIEFVHQCNPSQRHALEAIVEGPAATAEERLLAQALLHAEHTASPDDKPHLMALMRDKSASAGDRTLAAVIYNLVHAATDVDKDQLKRLKEPVCCP